MWLLLSGRHPARATTRSSGCGYLRVMRPRDLRELGWNERLEQQFESHAAAGLIPGRVAVQHRGSYDVLTAEGERRCDLAGRLAHAAGSAAELPAVGDWVAVARRGAESAGTIAAVLPRRTRFSRKTAWQATEEQVLAANIDVVFIVSSLNEELNLRRIERYLTLAWDSGARPVLVLTKSDLHRSPASAAAHVREIARDVPVHVVSNRTHEGLEDLREHLLPGLTVAMLGSSGVGKSTLVNTLAGAELLATQAIRDDGRGRHTTTRRELVLLPCGSLVIDTPGLRELQLWDAHGGLDEAFADVTELFGSCRFTDCAHDTEPGCAVREALEGGRLAASRWESYLALQRELGHLERKLDQRAAAEARRRWKALGAEARANARAKGRKDHGR